MVTVIGAQNVTQFWLESLPETQRNEFSHTPNPSGYKMANVYIIQTRLLSVQLSALVQSERTLRASAVCRRVSVRIPMESTHDAVGHC